ATAWLAEDGLPAGVVGEPGGGTAIRARDAHGHGKKLLVGMTPWGRNRELDLLEALSGRRARGNRPTARGARRPFPTGSPNLTPRRTFRYKSLLRSAFPNPRPRLRVRKPVKTSSALLKA